MGGERGVPSPIPVAGVDGWLGVLNSGRRGAGNCRQPPAFPDFPESPAARRSLSFFSLLAELPFCSYGSLRFRSVSFCPPLRLSSLGSFLFTGPRREASDFQSVPFLYSAPVRLRSLEPGASSARSPNRPGLPPLLSARRREARGVGKNPAWHLSSSPGAVSRTVPASRGAAACGRSVARIAAFPEDLPAFLCSVF